MVQDTNAMSNDDLELQDNTLEFSEISRNTDALLLTPSQESPLRQQFYKMSEYFNILDRVFHYKRMNRNNENFGENNYNASSSSGQLDNQDSSPIVEDANDGVFSNLSAKPESSIDRRERLIQLFHQQLQNQETHIPTSDQRFNSNAQVDNTGIVYSENATRHQVHGGVYNINQLYEQLAGNSLPPAHGNGRIDDGEIEHNDKPPSYDEAHNDTVPSYWDLSPEGSLYYDEICVNGLPAGSIVNFVWNCIVSACFQFFGFLLSYILHTSHAAKEGSRCGLGITFIFLGLRTMPNNVSNKVGKGKDIPKLQSLNPLNHDLDIFLKGLDSGSLTFIDENDNTMLEDKKNEKEHLIDDFKEYMETHYSSDYGIATKTLSKESTETEAIAMIKRGVEKVMEDIESSNTLNQYMQTDKAEFVKTDMFESTLSHGSEEKYDHTRNITLMKLLAIVLFISGGLLIIQSFYQYYQVKKMEAKLMIEQERLEILRDRYYEGRSVPVQEVDGQERTLPAQEAAGQQRSVPVQEADSHETE
ncbi:Metal homeostatis protein HuBSD2 [Hanseniaspora uvarum DSM 2768]|nr:Metal homeostatis protein HuBSD2 [Hanseniaspora uvarum DSM 2768]